jgi:hypothetical protein
MNDPKPRLFMPALLGGAAAGLLSGIPFVNCCCCLWIIGGAALAAYLLWKDSPIVLSSGDGALVGAFAGILAAFIRALISIPFRPMEEVLTKKILEYFADYMKQMPAQLSDLMNQGNEPVSLAVIFFGLLISAALCAALGALGGVIGIALCGKKTRPGAQSAPQQPGPLPPPPPQP